jgi:hypothetical protein
MFGQTSIASKRQILFYTALDFSPNRPHLPIAIGSKNLLTFG